jgi:hypothetical protein
MVVVVVDDDCVIFFVVIDLVVVVVVVVVVLVPQSGQLNRPLKFVQFVAKIIVVGSGIYLWVS